MSTIGIRLSDKIINGNMKIDQRYAGTATGNQLCSALTGKYVIDRFVIGAENNAGTPAQINVQQIDADASSGTTFSAPSTTTQNFALGVKCGVAAAGGAATVYSASIYQYIEGYNIADMVGKAFFLTFRVKSNQTGIRSVTFFNNGAGRSYITEFNITAADTWQTFTKVVRFSSTGTWLTTSGRGMGLIFNYSKASSATAGTLDDWYTANYTGGSSNTTVDFYSSTSNYFYLADVHLVPVGCPVDSQVRAFSEELALCQRYYYKTFAGATAPAQSGGFPGSIGYYSVLAGVSNFAQTVRFPVAMRTAPTPVFYNPAAANTKWRNVIAGADSGTPTTSSGNETSIVVINPQVAGDGAGALMTIQMTCDAEL